MKELHIKADRLERNRDLRVYIEKLENLYNNHKELSGNPDMHISCKMFAEYFEAFLSGFEMMIELVLSTENEEQQTELLDSLINQLKRERRMEKVYCSKKSHYL